MSFTTTPLINGGVLVEGTDVKGNTGATILRSTAWEMVVHLRAHEVASEQFDQVVKEFFAPLTEAADAAQALIAGPTQDWAKVTLGESVKGHEAEVVQLDSDGIILRLLDEGHEDSLRWVGENELVATA
jgi:hypothetical protein